MNKRGVALGLGALLLVLAELSASPMVTARFASLPLGVTFALLALGVLFTGAGVVLPSQARPWKTSDPQPWNFGEALGVAWQSFGAAPVKLTTGALLAFVPYAAAYAFLAWGSVSTIISHVQRFGSLGASASSPSALFYAALGRRAVVVGLVVSIVLTILLPVVRGSVLAFFCRPARGEAPRIGDLLRAFTPKRVLGLLAAEYLVLLPFVAPLTCALTLQASGRWTPSPAILVALGAVTLVALVFVLPGFALAKFFVIDADLGPIDALAASWNATRGSRVQIYLYQLGALPVLLIGLMAFGVGAFFTFLLYDLGFTYLCTRVASRTERPLFSPDWGSRYLRGFLRTTFAVNLLAFGIACIVILKQAPQRSTGWSFGNAAVRVGAVSLGVALVLSLLAAVLPAILDALEKRGFAGFVGARHVRSQKNGFLTIISVLSIFGVALSSCSLSSVSSIMGGFSADLKRKILGNNAHIVIDNETRTAWEGWQDVLDKVRAVPGVAGATPVVQGEVMVQSASNLAGVIVRGVDPETIGNVIEIKKNIEVGKFEYLSDADKLRRLPSTEVVGIGKNGERFLKGKDILPLTDDLDPSVRDAVSVKPLYPGVVIGRELAKTLHVYVGDDVTLVSPLGDLGPMGVLPRMKKFRVAAVFYSGMYEYDASHVYIELPVAQEYFGLPGKVHVVDIKTVNVQTTELTTPTVRAAVPRPELRVRDWREINRNLFSALKLERYAMFIIMSIAIMVASFCIVCTLLLMVTEKGKEIAILKAMGASDRAILQTFMGEGVIIGAIGTAFGVTMALALCLGLSWFGLPLNPEVYYIDRLPVNVDASDFLVVTLAALTICTVSTIYPALAASRIRPVDGLRYE